jgi:hypothetical protein
MPTYAMLIIFNSGTHFSYMPFEIKKLVFILVILSTLVIPIAIIPFLINLKVVSDFTMEKGRERFFPFLVTAMAYYFAYQLLKNISLSMTGFIEIMLLASAMLVFFCLLVSLKWKISAHLTGIGGMMGAMIYFSLTFYVNSSLLIMVWSLIAGATAYARLQLNAHTPAQVYVGFISGFGGMAGVLYFGL